MAEEAVEEVAEEAPAEEVVEEVVEQVAEAAPAEEGADWRDGIEDVDARKHSERFTSIEDMAKANLDQRKAASKTISPLRANASEEAVAEFNKAMGVPERVEDYEFTQPEHMTDEMVESEAVQNRVREFAEIAHAAHIPSESFDNIVNWYFGKEAEDAQAVVSADSEFAESSIASLKQQWGPQYEKEVAFANKGAEWAAAENFEDFRQLTDGNNRFIADNPIVIEMMNRVGRAVTEDGVGTFPIDAETANSLRSELNDLTVKQDELMRKGDHTGAQNLDLKIMALANKISGDEPVQGA